MKRIICCISIIIVVLFQLHLCQADGLLDKRKGGKYENLGNAEQTTPSIILKTPKPSPPSQVIRGPIVTASATPKPMPESKNFSAIQIASRKCQEYEKHRYVDRLEDILMPEPSDQDHEKFPVICAVAELPENTPTKTKEYPHMAVIGYGKEFNNVSWECDGALISEKFVMSSARCTKSSASGPPKWVILRELDVRTQPEEKPESTVYNIVKIHVHPNYKSSSYHHDISLIELNTTVKFKPYLIPACLHTSTSDMAIKQFPTITGWERTGTAEHEQTSDTLLKALVIIADHQECEALYNGNSTESNRIYDPNTMICARDPLAVNEAYGSDCHLFEKSHIKADSGSPLQIGTPGLHCMRNIIGIASFGTGICQNRTNPGIYTKVSHYVDWIQSVVWP